MIKKLILIFHKNTQMYLPQKPVYRFLLGLIILFIAVPCMAVVGFTSYVMTQALAEAGAGGEGLLLIMQVLSAFSMVFGTWVVFNLLFFSSDREHLSVLPVPDRTLLMAKFLYSYMAESAMEFFLIIAAFAGYFAASGPDSIRPVALVSAALGVFLIPLLPMIYAALFSMLMMAFFRGIKNRDTFFHATTLMTVAFIGLFLFSLRNLGTINMDNYVDALAGGGDMFLGTLNIIFFPVPWLCRAVAQDSAMGLGLYIVFNLLVFLVMYLPGGRLYRRGLYAAAALGASHAAATGKNALKVHSPFTACLLKEFRVLIRTKAYANNCVYVNLLLPVMAFGLVHFMGQKGALADFAALYREGRERAAVLLTLAVLVISFLTTALNCLASTAFTREGLHIDMMKYLPVDYRLQVLVKASVSFLITWPVLLVTVLILCFFVGAGPGDILYYAAISLMAHLLSLFAGMYLDSFSPYILWEDEYSALRGNVSSFFNMGVNMLISLLLTGVSYLLYEGLRAPLALYRVFLLLLLLGSVTLTAALCFIKTVGNVEAL